MFVNGMLTVDCNKRGPHLDLALDSLIAPVGREANILFKALAVLHMSSDLVLATCIARLSCLHALSVLPYCRAAPCVLSALPFMGPSEVSFIIFFVVR